MSLATSLTYKLLFMLVSSLARKAIFCMRQRCSKGHAQGQGQYPQAQGQDQHHLKLRLTPRT